MQALDFSYDAAGDILNITDANRLSAVTVSGQPLASYVYNARVERVSKTVGGDTRYFHYDLQGNLIGEFEGGAALRAYVYVEGERVALIAFGLRGRRTCITFTTGTFSCQLIDKNLSQNCCACRYGVKNRLKMLIYSRVNSAFSPVFALSRLRSLILR